MSSSGPRGKRRGPLPPRPSSMMMMMVVMMMVAMVPVVTLHRLRPSAAATLALHAVVGDRARAARKIAGAGLGERGAGEHQSGCKNSYSHRILL